MRELYVNSSPKLVAFLRGNLQAPILFCYIKSLKTLRTAWIGSISLVPALRMAVSKRLNIIHRRLRFSNATRKITWQEFSMCAQSSTPWDFFPRSILALWRWDSWGHEVVHHKQFYQIIEKAISCVKAVMLVLPLTDDRPSRVDDATLKWWGHMRKHYSCSDTHSSQVPPCHYVV